MRVVGIHGIGNYGYFADLRSRRAAAAAMAEHWRSWLQRGLPAPQANLELSMAYYACDLHRGVQQGVLDDPALLPPEEQQLLIDWIGQLYPQALVAQGPRTLRARQAVDWLTRHYGAMARYTAMLFCREVHAYLSRPDSPRREAARQEVAEVIATHRPDVILAHSLGSVVTYETLWLHEEVPMVPLLLTLGSPLAMSGVVLDRLQPDASVSAGRPPTVERWVNISDVGDLVAIPRGGISRAFAGIEADEEVTIGSWDFHTAQAYLSCAAVAGFLPRAEPSS